MSGAHDAAVDALKDLLWELPAYLSEEPPERVQGERYPHDSFQVIKSSNVRKVHEALWTLQEYLGVVE